jgi:hypothetical protein
VKRIASYAGKSSSRSKSCNRSKRLHVGLNVLNRVPLSLQRMFPTACDRQLEVCWQKSSTWGHLKLLRSP